jgi:hypothetical protein
MYINAEVDDEEVFEQSLKYIFPKLPPEIVIVIARNLCENLEWKVLRDKVYLALSYSNNKDFIPFLEERLEKENGVVMKKNIQQVIDRLEKG